MTDKTNKLTESEIKTIAAVLAALTTLSIMIAIFPATFSFVCGIAEHFSCDAGLCNAGCGGNNQYHATFFFEVNGMVCETCSGTCRPIEGGIP
jgi:hypothetical protein